MRATQAAVAAVALLSCASCRDGPEDALAFMESPTVVERRARFGKALAAHIPGTTDSVPLARWLLPNSLREVSGLALTDDDRLFAHGDEGGLVAQIEYRTGVIIKEFVVGKRMLEVDFEGIAIADSAMFMIDSKGDVYEFREGAAGKEVEFAIHETGLKDQCEFEGVAYDRAIESLLLACKDVHNDALSDSLVIFRWRLAEGSDGQDRLSRLTIPLANVTVPIQAEDMRPSDITVDPVTGNYVIVASLDKALIELTPAGQVVDVRKIPDRHEQPEGLAITKDGLIIIADEAVTTGAMLTLYKKP